jgi:phage terminase Nu1 subunit (DNA packaging protein)
MPRKPEWDDEFDADLDDDDFDFDKPAKPVAASAQNDRDLAVDKHELAAITGLTLGEIEQALRDGMPVHGKRLRGAPIQFWLPEAMRWLLRQAGGDTLIMAKQRERAAVARIKEMEADRMEGRMVALDDILHAVTENVARLQTALMGIPARLTVAPDVREKVRAELVTIVNELAGADYGQSKVKA